MKEHAEHRNASEVDRPLAVYLRDHFAGATAGLALVRRCRREHAGTPLDSTLASIEAQISPVNAPGFCSETRQSVRRRPARHAAAR